MNEPIAITGFGCRLPGAASPAAFWRNLLDGHDAIGAMPVERLRLDPRWDDALAAMGRHEPRGAFLDDVYGFDWRALGIPPREARVMDPQQRLLLEVAWEALEDAGIRLADAAGARAGVYVSVLWNDHLRLHASRPEAIDLFSLTGSTFALLANRISFLFDLRGPSLTLDLGCAGSAQTVHLACEAIWSGEVDWALAGGVNLLLSPDNYLATARAGVLSKTGRCWTFDARADGFVPGEGAGLAVLKPLARAMEDGDRVYACVLGSASNHNGRTPWIMSVDPRSQADLLTRSLRSAGVRPAEVDVVEMHGTGTPTGDPVEVRNIAAIIGAARPKGSPVFIGSVKTSIGHLESAGSVAHILKTALALRHGVVPPTIRVEQLSAAIHPEEMNVHIPQAPAPLDPASRGVAVVTSLSLGGGNAQIVLARPPEVAWDPPPPGPYVLLVSARGPAALRGMKARWVRFLRGLPDDQLYAVCRSAALRRTHHPWRVAAVGHTAQELADAIAQAEAVPAPEHMILQGRGASRLARALAAAGLLVQIVEGEESLALHSGIGMESLPADAGLEHVLAWAYAHGRDPQWRFVFAVPAPHVDLPLYAWDHQDLRPEYLRAVDAHPL
ncbi:MAG TPA: beta-ketoacyl synthase N-terminal-like domain-containing protein, partial [Myxococcota bacterium]|nr:beta-ketoacyl synthase N-terminal-like domain-containing protein [Myxococcota bacterium]